MIVPPMPSTSLERQERRKAAAHRGGGQEAVPALGPGVSSMQRGERSGRSLASRTASAPAFAPSVKGHHRRRPPYSESDPGESRGILGLT